MSVIDTRLQVGSVEVLALRDAAMDGSGAGGSGGPGGAMGTRTALETFDAGGRGGAFDTSTGFPKPLAREREGLGITAAVAAAAVLLLLVGAGLFVYPWLSGEETGAPAAVPVETTGSRLDDSPSGTPETSPSASPSASASPSPSRTTPRAPTTTTSRPPDLPVLQITVLSVKPECFVGERAYTLAVIVQVTGGPIATATLAYENNGKKATQPMEIDSAKNTARGEVRLSGPSDWNVTATSTAARQGQPATGSIRACQIEVD